VETAWSLLLPNLETRGIELEIKQGHIWVMTHSYLSKLASHVPLPRGRRCEEWQKQVDTCPSPEIRLISFKSPTRATQTITYAHSSRCKNNSARAKTVPRSRCFPSTMAEMGPASTQFKISPWKSWLLIPTPSKGGTYLVIPEAREGPSTAHLKTIER
jgi:hypothetical protein